MSRVGKQPIVLPSGVTAGVSGRSVVITGPRGKLECSFGHGVEVSQKDNTLVVSPTVSDKQAQANYGTTRAHLNNMVKGVTQGWKRSLELSGVGFTAKVANDVLTLTCGFSHEVRLGIPSDVKCVVTKTVIELESYNKESLGTFAAKIRKTQPPEPYLGKGIRFSEESVRRKAGKTGKK
jgi:large subunit ribosomal protein L6